MNHTWEPTPASDGRLRAMASHLNRHEPGLLPHEVGALLRRTKIRLRPGDYRTFLARLRRVTPA